MSSSAARQASIPVSKSTAIGRILSAADYAELLAGENRRDDSECRFDGLPSLHDQARLHGYRQGLCSVFADLNATLSELRSCREDHSAWLESFVLAVLHKVLGAQNPTSLVPDIVQQAIEECDRSLEAITVHVHPEAAVSVEQRIEKVIAGAKHDDLRINVVADDRLSDTACELHTPFGIIDAGLDTQLDALAEALSVEKPAALNGGP